MEKIKFKDLSIGLKVAIGVVIFVLAIIIYYQFRAFDLIYKIIEISGQQTELISDLIDWVGAFHF